MGLSKKAIKGVGWAGSLQVGVRILSLVKYIFIARLLTPLELGIFGIAVLTVAFFESMSETGISSFLVYTDKNENEYISSAWLLSVLRGFILAFLTVVFAYPVALFYGNFDIFNLLLFASLIPLVKSFLNPSVIKLQKHLKFDKEFFFRISVTLFDLVAAIILLFIFRNALSLVLALIASTVLEVALSFVLFKPRPSLRMDRSKLKEMFNFGKWITLIGASNYFARQLDSLAVGKLLGLESLGIYQLAQKFSVQLMTEGGDVFARVAFPVFSKIRGSIERTRKAFNKIILFTSVLFGIITLLLIVFSTEFLLIFAGLEWISASAPLKYFALTGFITALMSVVTALFLSFSRQDITAKMIMIRLLLLAVLIVPASLTFGIIGASFVSFISYLLVVPFAVKGAARILRN